MKKLLVVLVVFVVVFSVLVHRKGVNTRNDIWNRLSELEVLDSLNRVKEDSILKEKCKGIGSVAVFTIGKTKVSDIKKYLESWEPIYTHNLDGGIEQSVTFDYDIDRYNWLRDLRLSFWNGVLYHIETYNDYDITDAYVLKYGDGIKDSTILTDAFVTKHIWESDKIYAESYHTIGRYKNLNVFKMYDKNINSIVNDLWSKKREREELAKLSKI